MNHAQNVSYKYTENIVFEVHIFLEWFTGVRVEKPQLIEAVQGFTNDAIRH